MPTSSSDDALASCFSDFLSEKIIRIRREIDESVVNQEFSVDFPLHFTRCFKNTKNLFIHIAHYPVRRFLRDIPTFLKCPLHSLVGAGVGSDRYQGDSAHETQPTRHCLSSRYRVWMCCSIALASTSPFAYFTYIS